MGEKKVKGRKRHIVTDTQSHLLHVKVHAANTHDTVAGCGVLEAALQKYSSLQGVCADAGYRKTMEEFVIRVLKKTIEISACIVPGWAVLAKRWVVERTFAWLNHFRRLLKDYEITVKSAENIAMIAHSMILLKRLAQSVKMGSKILRIFFGECRFQLLDSSLCFLRECPLRKHSAVSFLKRKLKRKIAMDLQ